MATTFDQLVARVKGLEHRSQRAEEDITSIIATSVETRDDVKVLKRDVKWLKGAMRETREDLAMFKRDTRNDLDSLKQDVGSLTEDVGSLKQDVGSLTDTAVKTRDDVDWLKRATQALLDHNGVRLDHVPADN